MSLSVVLWTMFSAVPAQVVAATPLYLDFAEPGGFSELSPHSVLDWDAEPGKTYLVQSADVLSSATEWTTEEPVTQTAGSVGPIRWMAPESIREKKFYRLVLPQPEIQSLEPAFIDSGDTNALLYLTGQCLPTNGFIVINGQLFNTVQSDSNGTWVAVSLNSLSAGTSITGTVQILDGSSNIVAELSIDSPVYYGTAPSNEQLQGPPEDPPAAPGAVAVEYYGLRSNLYPFTKNRVAGGKKGYDYYKVWSDAAAAGMHYNPPFQENDQQGEMPGAKFILTVKEKGNRTKCGNNLRQLGRAAGGATFIPPTGEVRCEAVDLVLPGRGMDFAWTRTYRSRTGSASVMGHGWDHAFNISIDEQPDGTLLLRDGSGRTDTFYPDGTNGWLRAERFERIGDLNNDGMPDVLFADGSRWLFHPDGVPSRGKVALIEDLNGNTISMNYDGAGRLESIVDTLGRTNTIAYNVAGLIQSITDFTGRSVSYQYDGDDNLTACISPPVTGTPNGNDFPGGKTNQFSYTSGYPDERLNHNLTSITDPAGQTWLQISYFTNQNPASIDFDCVASVQRGIEKADIRREPVSPSPDNGYAVVRCIQNDYVGNVTESLNDARQRCVQVREFTGRADPLLPTTSTANRPAVKLRLSDPDYFETNLEWNPDSLCTRILYPAGNSAEFIYQRAFNQNTSSSRFDLRAHEGDLRILRQRPCCDTDDDGDGIPDTIDERFEYDPRFGNPSARGVPPVRGFAINRKATGADPNRPAGGSDEDWKDAVLHYATSYLDPRGNLTATTYDAQGRVSERLRHKDRSVVIWDYECAYNAYGQLVAVTNAADAEGRSAYDVYLMGEVPGVNSYGYPTNRIIDAGGIALSTSYEYDALGRVTRVIDPRGNDSLFTYNQLDQLVQTESAPYGAGGAGAGGRVVIRYTYDANDNLVQVEEDNLDETANPDPANPVWTTTYEYDALNRLVAVAEEVEETPGGSQSVTNRFFYDGNDNLVAVHSPMAVSGLNPDNLITNRYDERDLLFRTAAAPGSPDQCTDQFDYDANGNLALRRGGLEWVDVQTTEYQYDGYDRLITVRDAFGNAVQSSYDRAGNLVHVVAEGELADGPGTNANVRLAETSYVYDALDRCVQRVDSFFDIWTEVAIDDGARTTTWDLAPNGQCISVTDDNGHATSCEYDTAGRLVSVTDAKSNTVSYAYDNNGNVISALRSDLSDLTPAPQEFSTTYEYDALNRLVRSIDNVGNTNRYAYDSRGLLVSQINPRENETFSVFDGLGRCTTTTNYEGKSRGITINTSHVEYNVNSRCTAATDANGNTTWYDYDSRDRCILVTEADGKQHSFVWNTRSDLGSSTDANGTVITNLYDALDRLTGRLVTPAPGIAASTTFEEYAYDGLSRLVYASNDVSRLDFAYDSLGHCVEQVQDGLSTIAIHDAVGNRLSLAYPGGRVVSCDYDALNRVITINNATAGLPPSLVATYQYDGMDRLHRLMRGNNIITTVEWNGAVNPPNAAGDYGMRQVASITDEDPGIGTVVDQRLFSYDRNQNKTVRVQGAPFFPGGPVATNVFQYDALDRMTDFTRESGFTNDLFISHVLDAQGNRLQTITNGFAAFYSMDNTFPDPADFQMNQYTMTPYVLAPEMYDFNGNLISRLNASGQWEYVYDYADRLVEVWDLSSGLAEPVAGYSYDPLGRRIRKTLYPPAPAAPVTTRYLYDGRGIIEERDGLGAVGASFILDGTRSQGAPLISLFNFGIKNIPFIGSFGGQDYYYHTDDLGNVLALTDASGTVVERYDYDDFGTPHFLSVDGFDLGTNASAVGNSFLFHGMEWDAETGFYFDPGSDAGLLDPQLGRTLTLKRGQVRDKSLHEWITSVGQADSAWSPRTHGSSQATGHRIWRPARMHDGRVGGDQYHTTTPGHKYVELMDGNTSSRLIVPVAINKGLRFHMTPPSPCSVAVKKEEGGRHTPFHNKYRPQFRQIPGIGQAGGIGGSSPEPVGFYKSCCEYHRRQKPGHVTLMK